MRFSSTISSVIAVFLALNNVSIASPSGGELRRRVSSAIGQSAQYFALNLEKIRHLNPQLADEIEWDIEDAKRRARKPLGETLQQDCHELCCRTHVDSPFRKSEQKPEERTISGAAKKLYEQGESLDVFIAARKAIQFAGVQRTSVGLMCEEPNEGGNCTNVKTYSLCCYGEDILTEDGKVRVGVDCETPTSERPQGGWPKDHPHQISATMRDITPVLTLFATGATVFFSFMVMPNPIWWSAILGVMVLEWGVALDVLQYHPKFYLPDNHKFDPYLPEEA